MATISSDMEEGARPRLHLFDLPPEIRDQIYGNLVSDTYSVLLPRSWEMDFRRISIIRVSKRTNWEAMQVLKRRIWFLFEMGVWWLNPSYPRKAPFRHMNNVELLVTTNSTLEELAPVFRRFAGTWVLRRTCHVLIPVPSDILTTYHVLDRSAAGVSLSRVRLEGFLGLMKSLTGFETVVFQIDVGRPDKCQGDYGYDFDVTKLPKDIEDTLGPTLGPSMLCSPVHPV